LRPSVIVVLPVMTFFAGACSSGGLQSPPRLDEALPKSAEPETTGPPLDTSETDPDPDLGQPQARAVLLLGCANDDVRACTYYLPEHNGVRQCVVGYQLCTENEWGRCLAAVAIDGGSSLEPGGSF
jgi:hypothetical protein